MNGTQKIIKYLGTALAVIVMVLIVVGGVRLVKYFVQKKQPETPETVSSTTLAPGESGTALPTAPQESTAAPVTEPPHSAAAPGESTTAAAEQGTSYVPEPGTVTAIPGQQIPRNLDIEISAGSLTFVAGDVFNVNFDKSVIDVSTAGDTMTIENANRHPTASERRRMNVTVTVPENYAFGSVDIEFGAGKMIVHSLKAETLDLEMGAGSATFDDIYISGSAGIKEGAGELVIKDGVIYNLALQCGAGATRVTSALRGASRIDAAVGAVDLKFDGTEADYTVAFQMGLGACYYNNEKIARNGSFGTGANTVDITGGFGVMRVTVG